MRDEHQGEEARRFTARRVLAIAPLPLLLALWVYFLILAGIHEIQVRHGPNGALFGSDFAMFYSASVVMREGGNPYDHQQLYRTEAKVMQHAHRAILKRKQRELIRVGNPPLFFWALRPLTSLPFATAAYAWMAAMYAAAALGFVLTALALGWRRLMVPLILFLLMPQVVDAPVFGNPIALVLAALGASILLLRRFPFLAGLLMTLAWLKPQVALPIVALVILFHVPAPWRTAAGLAVGSLATLLLTIPTSGWTSVTSWLHGSAGYTSTIAIQPDLTSLVGIYYKWAPAGLMTALVAVTLLLAVALTAWWWWHRRATPIPIIMGGWLWAVWYLATPYAHFEDQMLLLAPVLALFGRDGSRLSDGKSLIVLYLLLLSVIPEIGALRRMQLLWVPLLGITVCLALAARDASREEAPPLAAPAV